MKHISYRFWNAFLWLPGRVFFSTLLKGILLIGLPGFPAENRIAGGGVWLKLILRADVNAELKNDRGQKIISFVIGNFLVGTSISV